MSTEVRTIRRLSGRMSAVAAADLAATVLGPDGWCFITSAETWRVVRSGDRETVRALPGCYELRWFGEAGEVRWLRDGDDGKVAVLLVDGSRADACEKAGLNDDSPAAHVEILTRRYLCWAVADAPSGDMVTLKEGRTATVQIPLDGAGPGDTLRLEAWELVADVGDGNMRVIDQMMRRFVVEREGSAS